MVDLDLIAWIDLCIAAIAAMGPEIWFVELHRKGGFSATCDRWSLRERFPCGTVRWLKFRKESGKWRKVA
jgi:hypothetical protein